MAVENNCTSIERNNEDSVCCSTDKSHFRPDGWGKIFSEIGGFLHKGQPIILRGNRWVESWIWPKRCQKNNNITKRQYHQPIPSECGTVVVWATLVQSARKQSWPAQGACAGETHGYFKDAERRLIHPRLQLAGDHLVLRDDHHGAAPARLAVPNKCPTSEVKTSVKKN